MSRCACFARLIIIAALCANNVLAQSMAAPPTLALTLRSAIERALRNNLEIRVERYGLDVSRLRITGARGYYDPQLGLVASSQSSTTPTTSILQGGSLSTETSLGRTLAPTLLQNLPFGGSIGAALNTSRTATNSPFAFVDPLFSSGLTFNLQQPLLRGFIRNSVRTQLRILNLNSTLSETQFRQRVSEIVQRVEEQYWNLAYTQEAYTARQESRDLATNQSDQIAQKVQAGLLTPVALTSAKAEVAMREQDVIEAELQIVAAENSLKSLLADDPSAEIWTQRITAVDRPELRDVPETINQAMQKALHNRPEMVGLDLQLQQNRVNREFLNSETKPQVSLVASYGAVGAAGQVFRPIFDPNGGLVPIGRLPDPSHPGFGGYSTSLDQVFRFTYPNWSYGLNVQFPIFNRSARAQYAEADVERRRLETQVKLQQQAIVVEVANAYNTVELRRKAVAVARLARELSTEQLNGETARFAAGFTTNFEVVRYQRDLTDARVRELRSMIDYQIAFAALQKAMSVIVDENDIVLAKSNQ